MLMQRAAYLGGFLLAMLILVGCNSDNLAEIKGTVKFDGKPIDKGSIQFFPVDGNAATAGGEIIDGNYSVKVPATLMKVTISWPKVVGKKKLYDTPDSPERPIFEQVLPPKYADMNDTELKFEVKPGLNK